MTRRKASFLQGPTAAKYSLPAEDHRLNQAGLLIGDPTAAGKPLQVRPGVLVGPFAPGAVSVTTGGVNVNPFHAVVQGTVNGTQGPYLVTSDAVEFRAVTAASASEFRRGYVLVHVYDQISGIDVTDNWDVEVVYGPNAATAGAATLPSRTANSAILKEFAVSNTGVITLVAASGEFTGPRGGILPVLVDGANVPGHDGAAGSFLGQYRDHPTAGAQRWTGTVWGPPEVLPRVTVRRTTVQSIPGTVGAVIAFDAVSTRSTPGMWSAGTPSRMIAPETGEYDLSWHMPWANSPNPGALSVQMRYNGTLPAGGGLIGYLDARPSQSYYGSEVTGIIRGLELNANDYVEIYGLHNTDANRNVAAGARATLSLARR
jgi:hypothetical protein